MLDLKSILENWKNDCQIEGNALDETSRQTPALHAPNVELCSL